jgi:hypothetical protein
MNMTDTCGSGMYAHRRTRTNQGTEVCAHSDDTISLTRRVLGTSGKNQMNKEQTFRFDGCFVPSTLDRELSPQFRTELRANGVRRAMFEYVGLPILELTLSGYNTALFVYGQGGTGKAHTLFGADGDNGFLGRLFSELFARLEDSRTDSVNYKAAWRVKVGGARVCCRTTKCMISRHVALLNSRDCMLGSHVRSVVYELHLDLLVCPHR